MPDQEVIDLTVRAPEIGDMEALADLMTQLGYPTRTSEMQMRMETILTNKHYATFVAVSGGKVCGMIGHASVTASSITIPAAQFSH